MLKSAAEKMLSDTVANYFYPLWASQNNTDFLKKAKIGNDTSYAVFTQQSQQQQHQISFATTVTRVGRMVFMPCFAYLCLRGLEYLLLA